MSCRKNIFSVVCIVVMAVAFAGCSLIDEDMSDCGERVQLEVELTLITNLRTELETQLSLTEETDIQTALKEYYTRVFTDNARDVDLSFYATEDPMPRLEHITDIINDNQAVYQLSLPSRSYWHASVANIASNPTVEMVGDETGFGGRLLQMSERDTADVHNMALFCARRPMDVLAGVDQVFNVNLYMVNAASALVLDTSEVPDVKEIKVFERGFATGFHISDSLFVFDNPVVVRTDRVNSVAGDHLTAFASVHFPSQDIRSKVVIETEEPFVSDNTDHALWNMMVYVTLADGSTTFTDLSVSKPVRAGQLMVIKGHIRDNGAIDPYSMSVGASVTLDWQEGGEHHVDL